MRWMFSKCRLRHTGLGLLVAGLLLVSGEAKAVPLVGSFPLVGLNVSGNGATVGTSTQFTATSVIVSAPGVGNYSPIPALTSFVPSVLDLASFSSFTLSNVIYGSFSATSGSIVQHTANFLDILLLGVFTPGLGLSGFDPSITNLRISINQSGGSFSEATTLNSLPAIPEPGTLLLLGSGLIALFASHIQLAKS